MKKILLYVGAGIVIGIVLTILYIAQRNGGVSFLRSRADEVRGSGATGGRVGSDPNFGPRPGAPVIDRIPGSVPLPKVAAPQKPK